MAARLRKLVRSRARQRCEYCQRPEAASWLPFQLDHIIAEQHGGKTVPSNLAWSCFACNKRKGPNLAGIDDQTGKIAVLFNPRRHKWRRHFRWDGPYLRGRTSIGRATVNVLNVNALSQVAVRRELIDEGVFPPTD